MESSNNENHETKFVNDLEIVEEKAAAGGEEVRGGGGGGGGEIEEAGTEGEEVGGGEGGGEIEVEGEEQEKAEGEGEGEKAGGEEGKKAGGEEEQEKAGGGEEEEEEEEEDEEDEGEGEGEGERENRKKYWRYIPLQNAALRGDWDSAKRFFAQDPDALTAYITYTKVTALHVAIMSRRSIEFVEKLVDLMPPEALVQRHTFGQIALHTAAAVGNTEAAAILVEKHPASLYIRNDANWLPLHFAAREGHKDTLLYLLRVTEDDPVSMPFANHSGALLFSNVLDSYFYDVALHLVGRYPELATSKLEHGRYAMRDLALRMSAFPSGSHLNRWQRLIYSYVAVRLENYDDQDHHRSDIEYAVNNSQVITQQYSWANFCNSASQKLQTTLWKVLELLVPHIKHIRKQKLMHLQAIQLVKCMCEKIRSSNDSNAYEYLCYNVIHRAAMFGIHEVVEEMIESFPEEIWIMDKDRHNIFQVAILYRCENVFNLIYQMSGYKQTVMEKVDSNRNSMLHLVGRLAPHDKLNLVPGAALQMQRELQWFKEVEKLVKPYHKEFRNQDGEIPSTIFTREHKNLVVQGEKWMKDTANSCTIAAALIATIAFAAAITVPGGNDGTSGLPVFSKEKAFIVFIISDAISLFTSTTSLLMFLSILTSRYAEGDFLYALPKRLIIGLVTLFVSITTMIVAFSSTLYLVFGHNRAWILIPVTGLACLPITSFVSLQFPLLVDLISSTYGRGIFGKRSDRPFY